jgi:hypothetical protein
MIPMKNQFDSWNIDQVCQTEKTTTVSKTSNKK